MPRFALPRPVIAFTLSLALVTGVTAAVAPLPATAAQPVTKTSDQSADVSSRPDLVSARIAAASQGSRVEVTSLNDEFSTTYVNPDGTETTDTSQTPLRVMQNGAWTPVNYTLEHVDGGWQPTVSPVPVVFSDGADADAADIGDGAKEVDLSWDVTLPKPSIDGATATYDLGGGESLVLTATSTGFEQSLVLSQAPTSLPHIKLPLDTSDLTMGSNSNGGFEFTNSAGEDVYEMPAPQMYGAAVDQDTGEPTESQAVSANLVQTNGGPQLDLTPSLAWLQNPSTTYPVTIDPSVNSVGRGGDTYIQANVAADESSNVYLHAGETAANNASRSFLKFSGVANYASKDITSATLKLWNIGANNCVPATMHVYALTSPVTFSNTWSDPKPTWTTTDSASLPFANGASGCANAEVDIPVQKIVQDWAGGQDNDGFQLSGTESAGNQGWTFCSMNPSTTGNTACETAMNHQPTLSITYNSIPSAPSNRGSQPCASTCSTGLGRRSDTARPTLHATVTDADGGNLRYDFEVYSDSSGNASALVTSGSTSGVTAGTPGSWTVPAGKLQDGHTYYWRVRAYDGTDYGAWLPLTSLIIDTTAPQTPTLTSNTFNSGSWTTTTSGSIAWSSSSNDVANYQYQLDNSDWTPTTATTKSFTFSGNALHVLNVQALDAAGNVSGTATFTVGEGSGAMTSPTDGTSTQKQVLLTAAAPSGSYVQYQYEQGATGSWTAVPSADVVGESSGNAPTSWPWTPAAISDTSQTAAASTNWLWNAHHTLGVDSGAFEVRACFAASSSGANPTCQSSFSMVQLATGAFGEASTTQQVGPGTLSLNTGDYSISATDADVSAYNGSLSVSRSLTTLDPAGATSTAGEVFGPGWSSSITSSGDADLTPTLASDKSSIAFTDATDSSAGTYKPTSSLSGSSITYTGTGAAADGSSVTYYTASACPDGVGQACIALSYPGDTTTTWTQPSGSGTWAPYTVVAVSSDAGPTTSSYYYTAAGLPLRIVAPAPAGVDCSTQAKATSTDGCRSLSFTYTTLTIGGSSVQRLSKVSLTAYNPATSAMVTTDIAAYDYDISGRLADAWDPRISPVLKTSYTYDANNRLATLTPPGLNTWSFSYDSSNRLITVSRKDPSGSTETTTIVYDIPTTGSSAPIPLDGGTTSTWSQSADLPATGVAIFPATHVPAGTTPSSVTSSDWPWASITYMDYLGQDVDDAAYGAGAWQIGASEYDADGDMIWSLTPGNLAQALNPTADTDPYVASLGDSAARANLLATVDSYDSNGDLIDEQGPVHPVVVTSGFSGGDTIDARAHSVYGYDSGSPNGSYYGLQTSVAKSALDITGIDYDKQTTTSTYDPVTNGDASGWGLGMPTTITDAAGLVTKNHYNAAGQLTSGQLPADSGNTGVRTTDAAYYTATGSGACVNPAVVGLVCTTQPDAQPSTGDPLPVVSYSYDMYDNLTSKTETYGSSGSKVVRNTTTTYDAAERKIGSSITVTPTAAGGAALPAVSYAYDSSTGLATKVSTGSGSSLQTLTSGYNAVGEQTSYIDAAGDQSTMTYDLSGRPASLNDGEGTTSYIYDTSSEHRGLLTTENIGVSGAPSTFTAAYDAAGNLASETYPNGLVAASDYNNSGQQTELTYVESGTTWMNFNNSYNTQGQVATQSSPESNQIFGYDGSDRLTTVADTDNGICTTRDYSYDNESNRSSLASYPAAGDATCTTSTSANTTNSSYDQADRTTNTGYAYDSLGRTITVPAADAIGTGSYANQSGQTSIAYFANDMTASEMQGGQTLTNALDPSQNRIAATSDGSSTTTYHYSSAGDFPTVLQTGATAWVREVSGIDGLLEASIDNAGNVTLQLHDIGGNIVATAVDLVNSTGPASYSEQTEFGAPRSSHVSQSFAWKGAHDRISLQIGGLVQLGVRTYLPSTGRFLSVDSVPGGNANAYIYPADPINSSDLNGKFQVHWHTGHVNFDFSRLTSKVILAGAAWGIATAVAAALLEFPPAAIVGGAGVMAAFAAASNELTDNMINHGHYLRLVVTYGGYPWNDGIRSVYPISSHYHR